MNVKEMLFSCDMEQAAALHFAIQEPPKCEDWKRFLQMHREFLKEITDITPIPGDYVILGAKFHLGEKVYSEIAMYCKSEFLENFNRCEAWEGGRSLDAYSNTEVARIAPDIMGYVVPEHYDMELMPWEELLGVEVFEENLRTIGHERLAAMVIREMSVWGLRYERSCQGQHVFWKVLQEALQEVDPHRYTSPEEVFTELNKLDDMDEGEVHAQDNVESRKTRIAFAKFTPGYWARATIAQYRELLRYVAYSSGKAHPMLLVCAGVEGAGKTSVCGVFQEAYANIMETALLPTEMEQIRKARQEGYYIRLAYLGLNTLEAHLQRIQNRVAKGGANADPIEVDRQFRGRFAALTEVISLCHEAAFYDCTNGFCRVAEYRYGRMNITREGCRCSWLNEWLDSEPPGIMVTVWSDLPSYERMQILQVIPNDDFSLTLGFSNGEYRCLDMKLHLHPGTAYEKIMHIEDFRRVYLDGNAVCWDMDPNVDSKKDWYNVIDLCPDWCYIMSVPCVAPTFSSAI